MASNIAAAIRTISGSTPSQEDLNRLAAIAHDLDIPRNDAMMPILAALDTYHGLFREMPKAMTVAAAKAALGAETAAKQKIDGVMAELLVKAGNSISACAVAVANDTARKKMYQWISGCVVVSAICLGLFGSYMHKLGYQSGFSLGATRAEWATTYEGRLAFKLSETPGTIEKLALCSGQGWRKQNGFCYANPDLEGKIYGWRLPSKNQ